MQPRHAIGVTMILAVAVFLGAFAGFRSAALSSQARGATVARAHATSTTIIARARRLDHIRVSLHRMLRVASTAVAEGPHFAAVPPPRAPAPATAAAPAPLPSSSAAAVALRPSGSCTYDRTGSSSSTGTMAAQGGDDGGGGGDD